MRFTGFGPVAAAPVKVRNTHQARRSQGLDAVRRHGGLLRQMADTNRIGSTKPILSDRVIAPVAQRIEHRPPEPGAQVRVLPGVLTPAGRRYSAA